MSGLEVLKLVCKSGFISQNFLNEILFCSSKGEVAFKGLFNADLVKTDSCYLLLSSTRTYIGCSNNPSKRLRQHNGEIKGGAKATLMHRPWRHKAIVTGFKTRTSALSFEWHAKHPRKSTLLKKISIEQSLVYGVKARIKLFCILAKTTPFCLEELKVYVSTH